MIDSWTKTIRNFSRNSPKPNVERAHGTKTWGGGEVEDIGPETRETVASSHNRRPPVPPRQRAQPSEEGEGRIPARGTTAIVGRPFRLSNVAPWYVAVCSPLCEPRPKILQLNDAVERRTGGALFNRIYNTA